MLISFVACMNYFSDCVARSAESEVANYQCGHMMRTRIQGTDEGGVAAGFAVLDTPFII